MKFYKFLAVCMLAFLASTAVFAQGYSSPRSILPWNSYIPERIADGFSSIIGQGGRRWFPAAPAAAVTK